ncbi:MAG: S1C family serine protease [Isosphaeraceae bacterium]
MRSVVTLSLSTLLVLIGPEVGLAQHKPEVIDRCKNATALVEVTFAEGSASGSAFCVDASGLFITNAHVVAKAFDGQGQVRLVLEIGLKTQRVRHAKVLRSDDILDLALLKVDDTALTPLELGKDDTLIVTAPVMTFGFPFGHGPTVRNEAYPDISVVPSHITSLRRDKGRLEGVQFDGQLNPGNSGGPVVDESGRVIGVAVATIQGAAMNLAIPVGRLSEFLKAPGVAFNPPPIQYKDRSLPVTWTIRVKPAAPTEKLPEKLTVEVKIESDLGNPRIYKAHPVGGGDFKVKVTPLSRDPDRKVQLDVRFSGGDLIQLDVKGGELRVGGSRFMLSDLRVLYGDPSPRALTTRGQMITGSIVGLGKVKRRTGKRTVVVDLNEASQITVQPLDPPPPVRFIDAMVQVKLGSEVVASVTKRAEFVGAPAPALVGMRVVLAS